MTGYRRAAVAVLLAVASFAFHLHLARELRQLGVFDQRNVLFDADISGRLAALSDWKHLGIKHPSLMPYFTPPIAALAAGIVHVLPDAGAEADVRATLGVLLVPAASALKTSLVFLVFCWLGYTLPAAIVATILESVSFSTIVFGTIPESYGLTALALAMAYALATIGGGRAWRRTGLWIGLGVFATGITITNVVLVGVLFAGAAWRAGVPPSAALARAAAVALAAFALTGASAYLLDRAIVPAERSAGRELPVLDRVAKPIGKEYRRFLPDDRWARSLRYPTAVADAFAPASVEAEFIRHRRPLRFPFGFTLERSASVFSLRDPLGTGLFLLLVAGGVCAVALSETRPTAIASLGILAFSWVLSTWGRETHLYSQHWHLAAVVLMAGVMRVRGREGLMTALLAATTVAVALHNLGLVRAMIAVLEAAP